MKKNAENPDIGRNTLEEFARTQRYNAWLLSRIRPWLAEGKLLEIGCGLGNITRLLVPAWRVTAVDIRKDYTAALARELDIPALTIDLSKKEPFRECFDSAVCLNVLEHIAEEGAALRSIFKALRPGGRFAVLVPAFDWLYGPVDKALTHQRRYTRRSLATALMAAGFTVRRTFYFNAFGIPGWFWRNRIRKKDTLHEGSLALFDRLVPLFRLLDHPFRPLLGISVVAWAEKPLQDEGKSAR